MKINRKIILLLTLLSGILLLNAQEKASPQKTFRLQGVITNEKGKKVKDAEVALSKPLSEYIAGGGGALSSATTNMAGKFSIDGAALNDSISIYKEGYWYKKVAVTNLTMEITLEQHNLGPDYFIMGAVQDDLGNYLEGVLIKSKENRNKNGVLKERIEIIKITGIDGKFSAMPPEKAILVFSKSGYETIEMVVGDLAKLNDVIIKMKKKE